MSLVADILQSRINVFIPMAGFQFTAFPCLFLLVVSFLCFKERWWNPEDFNLKWCLCIICTSVINVKADLNVSLNFPVYSSNINSHVFCGVFSGISCVGVTFWVAKIRECYYDGKMELMMLFSQHTLWGTCLNKKSKPNFFK